MASNLKIAKNTAQAQTQGLLGSFTDGSFLKIYDGIQPATPETALSSQLLLATIPLPASAAFSAINGVMTCSGINNVTVSASGTASWFRWYEADGTTVIADGTVGTADADLIISSVSLTASSSLGADSFTLTIPSS